MVDVVSYQHFLLVDIRVGTVVKSETFPKAKKPALKVWVDFGPFGVLKTSAQITVHYTPENLIGRQVLGCLNLGEKNIAGFVSQFLLLGFFDQNEAIVLASVDGKVPNGKRIL